MGLSASQARLLTITARLTTNEYESQQISNAKMRLATQSEEASADYIAALNSKKLQFTTYDAQGNSVQNALTASLLYQYTDMKNQYALVNSSGQMMVASADAKNFESVDNLDDFLGLYGVYKEYKSDSIAANVELLTTDSANGGVQDYYEDWEEAVNEAKKATYTDGSGNEISSDKAYELEKYDAFNAYNDALEAYEVATTKYHAGITTVDLDTPLKALNEAKANYSACITYDEWAKSKAAYTMVLDATGDYVKTETDVYKNVQKYYEVLEATLAEAEDLGYTTIEDAYTYNDASKAQWYTNLWYRMNGESSEKSTQGKNAANYAVLDSKLATSEEWIQDALTQGLITLEVASNKDVTNTISDMDNPTVVNLKGISWDTTMYNTCVDFTEGDDDVAIAKAEAEYERKNTEISNKDTKYENRIKTLDTEHNALQTEYESVQSAMNKNIERSFKVFS
jgi:hypothetical protein